MNTIIKNIGRYAGLWFVSGTLLTIILLTTDPLKLPLPILLMPFIVFFIWARSAVISIGLLIRRSKEPTAKLRVVANSVAAIMLVIITLQSLGQLSWRDILLILGLILGMGFYFYKTDLI